MWSPGQATLRAPRGLVARSAGAAGGAATLGAWARFVAVSTGNVRSGAGGSSVAPRPKPGRTITAPAVARSREPNPRRCNGVVVIIVGFFSVRLRIVAVEYR